MKPAKWKQKPLIILILDSSVLGAQTALGHRSWFTAVAENSGAGTVLFLEKNSQVIKWNELCDKLDVHTYTQASSG